MIKLAKIWNIKGFYIFATYFPKKITFFLWNANYELKIFIVKKISYLLLPVFVVFLSHYQILAQEKGKTVILSEKILENIEIVPFMCDYETIPKENHTYISAEFNTGIIQKNIETSLNDTIQKYVDMATSEINQMYDADAIIAFNSSIKTNENEEMLIIISGIPVKWKNFRSLDDYFVEQNKSKSKKTSGKGAIGYDLGIGAIINKNAFFYQGDFIKQTYSSPSFALGVRYMQHIKPYFDADFIKINFNCPFRVIQDKNLINIQLMTGIRGYTPNFLNKMSGYAAARLGYGALLLDKFKSGFALETELGLKIIPSIFIAFSYNLNCIFIETEIPDDPWGFNTLQVMMTRNIHMLSLRIGFIFK